MTRGRALAAVVALAAFVVIGTAGVALAVTSGHASLRDLSSLALFGAFVGVGSLILARRGPALIGWICLVIGLAPTVAFFALAYAQHPAFAGSDLSRFMGWLQIWLWVPTAGLAFTFLPLLFPDGRPPSLRWRPVALLDLAVIGVLAAEAIATANSLLGGPTRSAAETAFFRATPTPLLGVSAVLLGTAIVLSTSALAVRYANGSDVERQQLRWVAAAAVILAVGMLVAIVVPPLDVITFPLTFLPLPIALGVAILRYRLYGIDIIVNRALVYIPLLGILGGLYTASIALFQRVSIALTGDRSDAAVIATTLIVASVFTPVRKWLEAIVERRYGTSRPDAGGQVAPSQSASNAALDARVEAIAERVSERVFERYFARERAAREEAPSRARAPRDESAPRDFGQERAVADTRSTTARPETRSSR
jgi:hypothetical protein